MPFFLTRVTIKSFYFCCELKEGSCTNDFKAMLVRWALGSLADGRANTVCAWGGAVDLFQAYFVGLPRNGSLHACLGFSYYVALRPWGFSYETQVEHSVII